MVRIHLDQNLKERKKEGRERGREREKESNASTVVSIALPRSQCVPVITRMRGGMCTMSAMFKDNAFDIKHLLDSLNSIMLAVLLGNKYNKSCGNRES